MRSRRTLPLLLAVLLTGCSLLSRPQIRHYTLEPIAPAGPVASVAGAPLGIAGVELPPGLDRREVAVRTSDQRLDVRGTDLWAAPLERMVLHTLAFDLAGRMPEGMIVLPGQPRPPGGARSLQVVFEELAAGPEPTLALDARWTLAAPGPESADLAHRETISEPMESLDSASVAAATSRALARLAERIVARLAEP